MFPKFDKVAAKAEALISKIDALLPVIPENDWSAVVYRWQRIDVGAFGGARGVLCPVTQPHVIRPDDLHDIDEQKERLLANTKQYVEGRTANNVLLTGARGTGKSSLVKAMLHRFSRQGLRLIEVDRAYLIDLPAIAEMVATRSEKFIVFADDLSFEAGDAAYKALKSVLDGGVSAPTENMLVYATSNRRHLMPERLSENAEAVHTDDGEIHPGETTEEKISLSERFGLWLSFYPFDQEQYLDIAHHWVVVLAGRAKFDEVVFRKAALLWALERGGRSGRIAYQFARDFAGGLSVPQKVPKRAARVTQAPRVRTNARTKR
ncbi:MAG: ATP-binding protein [Rhodocyclaceae bacterium]|jgi:predicted AAA+ superfamily ATPase|nr:ATP-binding protein [Rhodocyclaceae bacterium]MCA3082104.1 ATP-binding protein [Rhodocyclaceae bacterium]MCE2721662.1 ATP-binding protein [Betaproteobacteria bacterium]